MTINRPVWFVAFGLAWAVTGLAFAGVAAVAAQLTTAARGATAHNRSTKVPKSVKREVRESSSAAFVSKA